MRGTVQDITEYKKAEEELRESEERYRIVAEQTGQLIYDLEIDEGKINWAGAIEKITGYTAEELNHMQVTSWLKNVHPDDLKSALERVDDFRKNGGKLKHELRFKRKDGEYIFLEECGICLVDKNGKPYKVMGVMTDVTERKKVGEALAKIEIARKQEIHHRIKNNLQVISSLLDLQADKFNNREDIRDSEVLNAFRESQDRVMSIALIHEELHEGGGDNTVHFSQYLERLVDNLFQTYSLGNADISLKMDLEENILFDIDTAVPLGIIVNELVSNSLKYAFPGRNKGEIQIKLFKDEKVVNEPSNDKGELTGKGTRYTLIISDDGIGISEKIDLENPDTLGLQLVSILVDQLDGEFELKRDKGTEFDIKIDVV